MAQRGRSTSPKPLTPSPRREDGDVSMSPPRNSNGPGRGAASGNGAPNFRVIVVSGLSKNVHNGHLEEIFGEYGKVTGLDLPVFKVSGLNRGKAAIEFERASSAEEAVRCMDGGILDGSALKVQISEHPLPAARPPTPPPRARSPPRRRSRSFSRSPSPRRRSPSPRRRRSPSPRRRGGGGGYSSYRPPRSPSPRRRAPSPRGGGFRDRPPPAYGPGARGGGGYGPGPRGGPGGPGGRFRSRSRSPPRFRGGPGGPGGPRGPPRRSPDYGRNRSRSPPPRRNISRSRSRSPIRRRRSRSGTRSRSPSPRRSVSLSPRRDNLGAPKRGRDRSVSMGSRSRSRSPPRGKSLSPRSPSPRR